MRKLLNLAFTIACLLVAQGTFATIYGPTSACVGSTVTMVDSPAVTGGTWSSSNPSVATIASSSSYMATINAVAPGVAIISYSTGSGLSTMTFTVGAMPGTISGGTSSFCVGSTTALSSTTTGGTWSSTAPWIATVGASSGIVTGVSGGTATIQYTMGTGCYSTHVVTVDATPTPDSLVGAASVCAGASTTWTCVTSGGTWSSSATGVATVSSTGLITGVTPGSALISYTVSGACGSASRTRLVVVTSGTSAGTISGTTSVMVGFTTSLYPSVGGGSWSTSDPSVAGVSTSGVVTGVSVGTAVISYAVTGCGGVAYATTVVTVTATDCISGDVLFTSGSYYGAVRLWLIKYNPSTHMLTACDSTYVYCTTGTSVHYDFCGMATDSFRVKAAIDTMALATGYLPTYHSASAYWSSASVVYHVSGTHDVGKNITMGYGTTTAGPGFIAGDVTTGANKGTADGDPVPNMLVFCVNVTTGAILQHTYTDAAGHYQFSNLPLGETLKIYPEAINYATTPFEPITLTSGATSLTVADFVQHTISMTITPKTSGVSVLSNEATYVNLYPNPATNVLNMKWEGMQTGVATIAIADITGRVVLASDINMSQSAGQARIDLTGVHAGIYMVTVKAGAINRTAKIQVQ